MSWRTKIRAVFRKETVDAEMSEEMRLHLELQEKENLARGMSAEAARFAAQKSFGGVEQIKERVREQRSWGWVEDLQQDIRYVARSLRRAPGFAAAVIFTLGFGIGSNTAVFTTVKALVLATLPVRAPEELVLVNRSGSVPGFMSFSHPFYEQARHHVPSLAGIVAMSTANRAMLAAGGGALGLLFASWGMHAVLHRFIPENVLQVMTYDFRPDIGVALFTGGLSLVTGVIVGLAPALHFNRLDLVTRLKLHDAGVAVGSKQRMNQLLVIGQIAISVCLLAGTGLFTRAVRELRELDLGFRRENILQTRIDLDRAGMAPDVRMAIARDLLAGAAALPDVRGVTFAEGAFAPGRTWTSLTQIDGYTPAPGEVLQVHPTTIGPAFFDVWGIPLRRGHGFSAEESFPPVAQAAWAAGGPVVISESMARKYFGNEDPVGRRLRPNPRDGALEIVGVAGDVMFEGLQAKSPFIMYQPFGFARPPVTGRITMQIRTTDDPAKLAPAVRALVHRVAPAARVQNIATLAELIEMQTLAHRMIAEIAGLFSSFALLLASIGIYGVLAYNVARRTREIGIRMALGADRRDVLVMIARQGLGLAIIGCLVGLAAASGLETALAKMLVGVSSAGPEAMATAALMFLAVSAVACWVPARRATKVDPMIALRAE